MRVSTCVYICNTHTHSHVYHQGLNTLLSQGYTLARAPTMTTGLELHTKDREGTRGFRLPRSSCGVNHAVSMTSSNMYLLFPKLGCWQSGLKISIVIHMFPSELTSFCQLWMAPTTWLIVHSWSLVEMPPCPLCKCPMYSYPRNLFTFYWLLYQRTQFILVIKAREGRVWPLGVKVWTSPLISLNPGFLNSKTKVLTQHSAS